MKSKLLTVLAIIGLSATLTAQPVPSYVPTNGLVGWWPFNGNANDESGKGNNGTVNGAKLTSDRFGNSAKAYSFDGINNRISLGNILMAIGTPNNPVTISLWFKTDSSYGSGPFNYNTGTLISDYKRQGACCEVNFFIELNLYDNPKRLTWRQRGNNSDYDLTKSGDYVNNLWYNIVLLADGIGTKKIYMNGVEVVSQNYNASANYADQSSPWEPDWQIGASHWNDGSFSSDYIQFFKGLIDDIGIWNRALTQQEITELYNAVNCANNTAITPSALTISKGSTATFTATTSDPNPSYVWQSDLGQGFQTLNNFGKYTGTTTASLKINNVQLSEHNQPIRVITTSGNCKDTSDMAMLSLSDTCLTAVTDTLFINAKVASLSPPNNTNTIKVFPNPTNDFITIHYGNFSMMSGYKLKIMNAASQLVYQTNITQQSDYLNLSTWGGKGIYFVQIVDPQGKVTDTKKIVLR